MATGQVSSITGDTWQLIATNTLTSGTSSSFTSISGYKTLMLAAKGVTTAANSYLTVRFNNDSSAGNYCAGAAGGLDTYVLVAGNTSTARAAAVVIYDANQSAPHKFEQSVYDSAQGFYPGFYVDPVAITRIDLISRESQAFTAGTLYLYGIAA